MFVTGKEIAKLRKEKMRSALSVLVQEQIANLDDIVAYFDTTKEVILADLEFLGLSEKDVTKDTNQEMMSFLMKKRDQLFSEIAKLPPEQHMEECAKYGFSFPKVMYDAFKDSTLFQNHESSTSIVSIFNHLTVPLSESELIQERMKEKQYRLEKLRHDATVLFKKGLSYDEIADELGISKAKTANLIGESARQAKMAGGAPQMKIKIHQNIIEDSIVRGFNGQEISKQTTVSSQSISKIQSEMGIISAKELASIKREDDAESVARLYETGMTQQEVADIKGYKSRKTVITRLREYYKLHPDRYDWDNFKKMHHMGKEKTNAKQIRNSTAASLYQSGMTPWSIAKYLNINENDIYKILEEEKVRFKTTAASVDNLVARRGLVWITAVLHNDRRNFDGTIRGKTTTDLRVSTGLRADIIGADLSILRSAVRYFGGREQLEEYILSNPSLAKEELNTEEKLRVFLQNHNQDVGQTVHNEQSNIEETQYRE